MNAMTELVREIHRIQILADIRRQQENTKADGRKPASRADVDGQRAAVILAELIEEGLVTQPAPEADVRLSPSGEHYLARVRRRDARASE